jgi:hypothetical protein
MLEFFSQNTRCIALKSKHNLANSEMLRATEHVLKGIDFLLTVFSYFSQPGRRGTIMPTIIHFRILTLNDSCLNAIVIPNYHDRVISRWPIVVTEKRSIWRCARGFDPA